MWDTIGVIGCFVLSYIVVGLKLHHSFDMVMFIGFLLCIVVIAIVHLLGIDEGR
jgi:hypothetical protein